MHKYLKDKDGNVFKAHVISSVPEGFEDITDGLQQDADTEGLSTALLELEFVDEVPAIQAVAQHWTNGTDTVYDANDIPTLLDQNNTPYIDPTYTYVAAVEAADAIAAHYRLKKKSSADQSLREEKMNEIRKMREPLLHEADVEINKLDDDGADSSDWRLYRKALRDVTEYYKKVDGDWKVAVDSIVIEEFEFPAKP